MKDMSEEPLRLIFKILDDKKAINPLVLDVRDLEALTDFFIFTEGTVFVHVKALAEAVVEGLKKHGLSPLYVEGLQSADWVVIDYGFIVVHLFIASVRNQYKLEQLWQAGKVLNLDSLVA
ncbi:ribosome silencing factor [Candidatus Clavichlamydia salmonicola]|uniref:ribosome silencing factor n=1 Tax=Candidatus Clavichlamydia salmonicola TaxID=469812 RepID=UPI001891DFD5|nr:ribosome silencing factor [Candidatus Clavichlamydia salmonicola]